MTSLEDDHGCIVLRSLQYLDAAGWSAVQHRVAVIHSKYSGRSEDTCVCSTIPINFFDGDIGGGAARPSGPALRTPLSL